MLIKKKVEQPWRVFQTDDFRLATVANGVCKALEWRCSFVTNNWWKELLPVAQESKEKAIRLDLGTLLGIKQKQLGTDIKQRPSIPSLGPVIVESSTMRGEYCYSQRPIEKIVTKPLLFETGLEKQAVALGGAAGWEVEELSADPITAVTQVSSENCVMVLGYQGSVPMYQTRGLFTSLLDDIVGPAFVYQVDQGNTLDLFSWANCYQVSWQDFDGLKMLGRLHALKVLYKFRHVDYLRDQLNEKNQRGQART